MAEVLFGVVTDSKDPESLGRVQVKLPDFSGDVILPWLRVAQPLASNASGILWLPEKDDHVVIVQGPGGIPGMVVIGCLYNGKRKPFVADTDGKNNIKQIYTRAGNEITLDDTSGSEMITIQTKGAEVGLILDKAGAKLTVTGKTEVDVLSDTKVVVKSKEVEITGDSKVTVKSGSGSVIVEGGQVEIKGTSTVKITGMVEIN